MQANSKPKTFGFMPLPQGWARRQPRLPQRNFSRTLNRSNCCGVGDSLDNHVELSSQTVLFSNLDNNRLCGPPQMPSVNSQSDQFLPRSCRKRHGVEDAVQDIIRQARMTDDFGENCYRPWRCIRETPNEGPRYSSEGGRSMDSNQWFQNYRGDNPTPESFSLSKQNPKNRAGSFEEIPPFYSQQPFFSTQPTTHSSYLTQRVKMENIQSPTPSPRRSQNYPETFYNDIPRHYHLGTYRNEHRGVIVGNVNEPNYPYQMFQKGQMAVEHPLGPYRYSQNSPGEPLYQGFLSSIDDFGRQSRFLGMDSGRRPVCYDFRRESQPPSPVATSTQIPRNQFPTQQGSRDGARNFYSSFEPARESHLGGCGAQTPLMRQPPNDGSMQRPANVDSGQHKPLTNVSLDSIIAEITKEWSPSPKLETEDKDGCSLPNNRNYVKIRTTDVGVQTKPPAITAASQTDCQLALCPCCGYNQERFTIGFPVQQSVHRSRLNPLRRSFTTSTPLLAPKNRPLGDLVSSSTSSDACYRSPAEDRNRALAVSRGFSTFQNAPITRTAGPPVVRRDISNDPNQHSLLCKSLDLTVGNED